MEILYNIERDGNNHFLAYMNNLEYDKLDIPNEVKDNIVSFGTSIDNKMLKELTFGEITNENKVISDVFCCTLKKLYERYWDFNSGIPYFKFKGKTGKFTKQLITKNVMIFFSNKTDNIKNIVNKYSEIITNIPNIYFLCNQENWYFKMDTEDYETIRSWLFSTGIHMETTEKKKTVIEQRFQQWYPDKELRTKLFASSKQVIDKFVFTKKLNIFIPEFLSVPVYHARRHQKAMKLMQEIYNPYMVMTLPVFLDTGDTYTVLFPIIDPINHRNYQRK